MTAISPPDSFTGHPQFVLQPQKINSVKWPENLVLHPLHPLVIYPVTTPMNK